MKTVFAANHIRCAIYARVSTDEQVKKYGLDVQLVDLREAAKTRGYVLTKQTEFVDEGYSGTDLDRPALNRLRQAAASDQIDVILVFDPDRLARKLGHQLLISEGFEKAGARLEFLTTEVQATPEGQMFFQMKGVFADYERLKFLDRSRRGRIQKAKSGFIVGCRAPYGYRYMGKAAGEKGKYVIHEPEAQIVRDIFGWLIDGASARSIVQKLNRLGIVPQRGAAWAKSSIQRMLRNEAYIGRVYFNRLQHMMPTKPKPGHETRKNKKTIVRERPRSEWIEMEIPAILSIETFTSAQERLKKNSAQLSGRNTKYFYLLRGLLRCGQCGGSLAGCPLHGRRYYRCINRDSTAKRKCKTGLLHAEKVETFTWELMRSLLTQTDILAEKIRTFQKSSGNDQERAAFQVAQLELSLSAQRTKEAKLLDEYLDLGISRELYERKHAEIMGGIRSTETALASLRRKATPGIKPDSAIQFLKTAFRGLDRLTEEGRRKLLQALIDRITIKGRELHIVGILPSCKPTTTSACNGRFASALSLRFHLKTSLVTDPVEASREVCLVDEVLQ